MLFCLKENFFGLLWQRILGNQRDCQKVEVNWPSSVICVDIGLGKCVCLCFTGILSY